MLQHTFEIAIALTLSASLFGQTAPANGGKPVSAPPVEVKRTRPQSDSVPKEGIPTPAQYPFGRLISELEGTSSQPPTQEPKSDATHGSLKCQVTGRCQRTFRYLKPLLTPSA